MKRLFFYILLTTLFSATAPAAIMTNVYGRNYRLLNGRWDAIVDLYDQGERMKVYENRSPEGNIDFYEYSFDGGLRLEVPGDWNSQSPELKYYEGTVWYARHFNAEPKPGQREFLYFGAVSYRCKVYLNGKEIASHEGGFTPFEVDVTDNLKKGDNLLVVEVNNRRTRDAIPALAFDWWNYGGITRDVMLVSVPDNYVKDYFIRLDKKSHDTVDIDVCMSQPDAGVKVSVEIPALGKTISGVTDAKGCFSGKIQSKKLKLWAPEAPELYEVKVKGGEDTINEKIGFRDIRTEGTRILINGKPPFPCAVESLHGRICSA